MLRKILGVLQYSTSLCLQLLRFEAAIANKRVRVKAGPGLGEAATQVLVTDSTDGEGFNKWSRAQQVAKGPIHFLEIRKIQIMLYRCPNTCLPYLDSLDPKLIPAYYQSKCQCFVSCLSVFDPYPQISIFCIIFRPGCDPYSDRPLSLQRPSAGSLPIR